MTPEITYKLANAQRAKLLEQYVNAPDCISVRNEIALARLLAVEAADAGNAALCNSILSNIAKLSATYQVTMERAGALIPREEAVKLALAVADAIADEFRDVDGFNERIDRTLERVRATFGAPPTKLLTVEVQA